MDSNTHSTNRPDEPPDDGLGGLVAAIDALAAQDLKRLPATVRSQRLLAWRQQLHRQEALWLQELANLDANGAAGADQDQPALSTASWLRTRLRMSAGAARSAVRTARALFGGSLPETAAALVGGAISPAHAQVVAEGTQELPEHVKLEADAVLLEAARRLDPPRLRQAVAHLCQVADPDGADCQTERRHDRRGLWLSPTWEGMVAVNGLLEAEAGRTVVAALEPLARPAAANDSRKGGQRTADALTELARRALESGELPKAGGVRPQLLVTVDLDSLLGHPGAVGGEAGWAGPLDPEACRRLACDGTVTRVMVSRNPDLTGSHQADHRPDADPDASMGLQGRLHRAMTLLAPVLGGAPRQPLEVGRATRVVHPAQRAALAVRDGGCVFPGCDRPLAWCDAHHLWHWVDGGPTDLSNLAMVCRAHHRTVHEGGWRLIRGPDGRFTVTPTGRRHRAVA